MQREFPDAPMRRQCLHLSAHPCEKSKGPVVAGWIGLRETEVSKEVQVRHLGGACLSCGNRQDTLTEPRRYFLPVEWA